jgi:hypothetical protein
LRRFLTVIGVPHDTPRQSTNVDDEAGKRVQPDGVVSELLTSARPLSDVDGQQLQRMLIRLVRRTQRIELPRRTLHLDVRAE